MESLMEAYSNWGQIIDEGSQGNLITPKPNGKFIVQSLIYSDWAKKNWLEISYPDEYSQWVKLRNWCVIDGRNYIIPRQIPLEIVGSVVGIGNSLEEAINKVKKVAKEIECLDKIIKTDDLDTALETIEKAKEYGINFPTK